MGAGWDKASLADPAAVARRRVAERAFGRWLASHPALVGLRHRLAALDDAAEAEALVAAAEPLLGDTGWLEAVIAAAARAAAVDPWFEPPFRTLDPSRQSGLVLHDDRRLRLAVQSVPLEAIAAYKAAALGARSVGFTGMLARYQVIRAGGAVLDLWAANPVGGEFAAGDAGRCRRQGALTLREGMVFTIDGARQAWTIARQTGDLVLLQASAPQRHAPLAIEYDATTGAFLSASATDGTIARMQLMASLLRLMGRRDAAPAIAALAEDGPFFLRWHMARELVALDPVAALPLLHRLAAGDPHAEVRAAAGRTLAVLAA